ncbi:MAG: hypothetical protein ACOYMB_04825 [Patescibacteria group bacterium]
MEKSEHWADNLLMYHKKSPKKFLESFKKALSFFPELRDVYVYICETKFYGVQHTLRAYPPLVTLHWPKSAWVYPITINKNKNINISFSDLSDDQQIGYLVHELSHIFTYQNFSRKDILLFSLKYAYDKKFVRSIEEDTDLEAIARGAGAYLLSGRIFSSTYRKSKPYRETEDTYVSSDYLFENLKKYPEFYSLDIIEDCASKLEEKKELDKSRYSIQNISFTQKLRHSIKTIFAFFPGFFGMFYSITLKKRHFK